MSSLSLPILPPSREIPSTFAASLRSWYAQAFIHPLTPFSPFVQVVHGPEGIRCQRGTLTEVCYASRVISFAVLTFFQTHALLQTGEILFSLRRSGRRSSHLPDLQDYPFYSQPLSEHTLHPRYKALSKRSSTSRSSPWLRRRSRFLLQEFSCPRTRKFLCARPPPIS